jgi:hypothetical protein
MLKTNSPRTNRIKKSLLVGLGAAALVLVGTAAQAVLTGVSGTQSDFQRYVNESNAWSTSAGAFVDVPGAATTVTIASGTRRMLDARFTAESQCTGSGGWCSVRIVVVRPNGSLLELNPQSGTDFAFDSGSADNWESHAIERTSPYLPAGTYRVKVQAGVVAGATSVRLDDWTLAVERVRP